MKIKNLINAFVLISIGMIYSSVISCALNPRYTDDVLEPYIEDFDKLVGMKEPYILENATKFQSLPGNVIGRCNFLTDEIDIDPRYWFLSTEKSKMALIYHELTHCKCYFIFHDDRMKRDGCPKSIMNTIMPSDSCLTKYWDLYMKDLKNKCNEGE